MLDVIPIEMRCILSKFYIKPQRAARGCAEGHRCILSKFYIKPQLVRFRIVVRFVVSYRNSTSNHNFPPFHFSFISLYLIEILHQTTTPGGPGHQNVSLYLIEILHQTTTSSSYHRLLQCCILSKFYIKPQHAPNTRQRPVGCILSKFYIKPQPSGVKPFAALGCILSKFYIKPQPIIAELIRAISCILSKFYIKPQRRSSMMCRGRSCILSKFYIKPQQVNTQKFPGLGCILSKFYIKPQPSAVSMTGVSVVSYRNSTSNHNTSLPLGSVSIVVSYRNSTSNHNILSAHQHTQMLYLIEILHQTTTSVRLIRIR